MAKKYANTNVCRYISLFSFSYLPPAKRATTLCSDWMLVLETLCCDESLWASLLLEFHVINLVPNHHNSVHISEALFFAQPNDEPNSKCTIGALSLIRILRKYDELLFLIQPGTRNLFYVDSIKSLYKMVSKPGYWQNIILACIKSRFLRYTL